MELAGHIFCWQWRMRRGKLRRDISVWFSSLIAIRCNRRSSISIPFNNLIYFVTSNSFLQNECLRAPFDIALHCGPLHTVHSTFHTVKCTLHTVKCTLQTVKCKLHTVHCTLYSAHCTVHTVHCTLYNARCTLHTVYYKLYIEHPKNACRFGSARLLVLDAWEVQASDVL